jgi:hypothetical protein
MKNVISLVLLFVLLLNELFYSQYLGINRNLEQYNFSSGIFNSLNYKIPTAVISKVITIEEVTSLRLKFSDLKLGKNSYILVEALEDNSIQKLDATTIEEWNNTSAYFNGNSIKISLFVGPGDNGIFFNTKEIIVGKSNQNNTPGAPSGPTGIEDLCGNDDRMSSNNKAVGRIITEPSGLFGTGFILFNGRIATAGHVLSYISETGDLSIIEFNVPSSNSDGSIRHAAAIDQYTFKRSFIIEKHENGEGDDYAIFYTNNTGGLPPKARQNSFFYIEQNNSFETARVTGFGQDDGAANHSQQTSTGGNQNSSNNIIRYSVDTKDDNSGSPVINEANGKVVGIHTGGNCANGYNFGTSFFNTSLWTTCNPEIDLTIHQKRENGTELTDTSYIGRWMGDFNTGSFQNYTVGLQGALIENVIYGNNEIFRAKQELTWVNSIEKYNNWANYSDVINQKSFLIEYGISELVAQHKKTYNGVIIKNDFPEVPNLNPTTDIIEFKDPWLIDYEDPVLNGTNYKNGGMASSIFKSRNSPFYPNLLNFYGSDQYLGVFIDQPVSPNNTYYSVRSPIQQPQDIYLSQTGKYHKFYFYNWTVSGTDPLVANNNINGYCESPVVFRSGNATVIANLKGTQLSNQTNAYPNTSQRRFIQTPDGVKHICYESMNRVWLVHSTDNGATWFLGNGGKPLSSVDSKNPSMSFYANTIGIVWQEKSGSSSNIKMAVFYSANYATSIFSTIVSNDCDYTSNANPVIGWGYNGKAVVVWSGLDYCSNPFGATQLKYWYGNASSNGISGISQCGIVGTDVNSINPTIAANDSARFGPTDLMY